MTEDQVRAIVLCAGGSRRMGRPKGLLRWRGRALLEHQLAALAPFVDTIVVVLGRDAEDHAGLVGDRARIVHNAAWATSSPIDSLRVGLGGTAGRCLVTPVDVPPPRPETLAALLAAPGPAVPTTPDGQDGHPVLLDAATAARVLGESPPEGLRTLLASASRIPTADPDLGRDFDTPEEWAAWVRGRG